MMETDLKGSIWRKARRQAEGYQIRKFMTILSKKAIDERPAYALVSNKNSVIRSEICKIEERWEYKYYFIY